MKNLLSKYGFTEEEINEFMSHALVIQCPKRTILLREGDVPRFFYWATKGVFRGGFTDCKGVQYTRAFFTPDTIPFVMSYGSFMLQLPSLSFLEAIEDGELLSWHYDFVKNLEDTSYKWLKFFKNQVDIVFSLREIKDMQTYTLSPKEQYLAFLESGSDFAYRIPQHYIASYIGITPEALSRIRKQLKTDKCVNI